MEVELGTESTDYHFSGAPGPTSTDAQDAPLYEDIKTPKPKPSFLFLAGRTPHGKNATI